mmetsp:Transcript_11820/g.28366  ORF Transcript_11820/g.28366 Transcript_11820/m.28366 type:complete len:365 (-) Transcript_11820:184-1278(-)
MLLPPAPGPPPSCSLLLLTPSISRTGRFSLMCHGSLSCPSSSRSHSASSADDNAAEGPRRALNRDNTLPGTSFSRMCLMSSARGCLRVSSGSVTALDSSRAATPSLSIASTPSPSAWSPVSMSMSMAMPPCVAASSFLALTKQRSRKKRELLMGTSASSSVRSSGDSTRHTRSSKVVNGVREDCLSSSNLSASLLRSGCGCARSSCSTWSVVMSDTASRRTSRCSCCSCCCCCIGCSAWSAPPPHAAAAAPAAAGGGDGGASALESWRTGESSDAPACASSLTAASSCAFTTASSPTSAASSAFSSWALAVSRRSSLAAGDTRSGGRSGGGIFCNCSVSVVAAGCCLLSPFCGFGGAGAGEGTG